MATHIRANMDFRLRGWNQVEVRIEAGNAMELVERRLRPVRKRFQLRLWQITEAHLDGSQFVKDHEGSSHETAADSVRAARLGDLYPRILGFPPPVVNTFPARLRSSSPYSLLVDFRAFRTI